MKTCTTCKTVKPYDDFGGRLNGKNGLNSRCLVCERVRQAQWRAQRPGYASKIVKRLYASRRQQVLDGYGGQCTCCGESHKEFLTVDHVNNNGNQERKEKRHRGIGSLFYKDIIDAKFPPSYQLLCYNCNAAKARCGLCPHITANKSGV